MGAGRRRREDMGAGRRRKVTGHIFIYTQEAEGESARENRK